MCTLNTAVQGTKYRQQLDTLERVQDELSTMWTAPDGGEYVAHLVHRGDEIAAEYMEVRVWFGPNVVSAPSVRVYGYDGTAPLMSEDVEIHVQIRGWHGELQDSRTFTGAGVMVSREIARALDRAMGVSL